jgi:hypothetical protein
VLPELAKRNDAVGAKAFVKYWFSAVTYAMKTGDTEPFMAVSAKDCKTCSNLVREIDAIYAQGQLHGEGGACERLRSIQARLGPCIALPFEWIRRRSRSCVAPAG